MEFKDKLIDLRKNRYSYPLSKKDVAQTFGKIVQVYMRYEDGPTKPTMDFVNKVGSFYGISTNYFFDLPIGRVTAYLPFFTRYDANKKRLLFDENPPIENIEEFSDDNYYPKCRFSNSLETILHKDANPTDFFFYEIEENMFVENRMIHSLFTHDILEFSKLTGGFITVPSIESARIYDFSNLPNYTLLMKKANIEDVFSQKYRTVYLTYDKKTKKTQFCLIYNDNGKVNIIPLYDISKDEYIDYDTAYECYLAYNMKLTEEVYEILERDSLSISDVEILAKTITIYPANYAFKRMEFEDYI